MTTNFLRCPVGFLLLLLTFLIVGCDNGGGNEETPPTVVDEISDGKITVEAEEPAITVSSEVGAVTTGASLEFTVSLKGVDDSTVSWSVNDIVGGNGEVGTIVSTGPNSARYTAPLFVPEAGPVVIRVRSASNTDLEASSSITISTLLIHVDSENGSDDAFCGEAISPCRSLPFAISLAEAGHTILVHPGSYPFAGEVVDPENLPLALKEGVSILGEKDESGQRPVITIDDPGIPVTHAIKGADRAVLSGFEIANHYDSLENIILTDSGAPIIADNLFSSTTPFSVVGLRIEGDSHPTIEGNTFENQTDTGFKAAIEIRDSASPSILGNKMNGGRMGISISGSATPKLENNELIGAKTDNSGNFGIGLLIGDDSKPDVGGGEQASVGGNTISCNVQADLVHQSSNNLLAINNIWDHVPPRTDNTEGGGMDVVLSEGALDFSNATRVAVSPCAGIEINASGDLVTTENGGGATFKVSLSSAPVNNVVIPLESSNALEGDVTPSSLTFTPENWDTPQVVTITGVADDTYDGDQTYSIVIAPAVSDDSAFDQLDADDVTVTNIDLDNKALLVINVEGSGSGTVSGAAVYPINENATVSAVEDTGSTFAGWSGPNAAECESGTVKMDMDKSCTAKFDINQYDLTLTTDGHGMVKGGTYDYGSSVDLTYSADEGYTFDYWSGSEDCTDGNVIMREDKSCIANFKLNQYTLTLTSDGYGTVKGGTFDYGSSVDLTYSADEGYTFDYWSGSDDCTDGNVTMKEDKSCIANFKVNQYTLTLTTDGHGTIAGSGTYNYGSLVTLTPKAAAGYKFSYWSGTDANKCKEAQASPEGKLKVTGSISCKANFSIIWVKITVIANAIEDGSGSIVRGSSFYCSALRDKQCSFEVQYGTPVTLSKSGGPDFRWDSCPNVKDGNCVFAAKGNITVEGTFYGKKDVTITVVAKSGSSISGTITSSPKGINCYTYNNTNTCKYNVPRGTSVTLYGIIAGNSWITWDSVCKGVDKYLKECKFTADENITITGVFGAII